MRPVFAALLLLTACGEPGAAPPDRTIANTAAPTAVAARPTPAATVAAACEPDAPESPCPIVGHWRIVRTFNPAGATNPTADDMGMTGATLTVTGNGAGPGVLRWDGPDTGQFDISDVCTGPFLSPAAKPHPDASRAVLTRALAAWGVKADAAAARHLGCDDGHWSVPSDPSGQWYGLVLPLGRTMAFEWYDDRMILAERIG